jgi:hypothetical protein
LQWQNTLRLETDAFGTSGQEGKMPKNTEKWPTSFSVKRITEADITGDSVVYLILGRVNEKQAQTAKELFDLPLVAKGANGGLVIGSVVNEEQFSRIREISSHLAKEWRGQYQAMTIALAEACKGDLG